MRIAHTARSFLKIRGQDFSQRGLGSIAAGEPDDFGGAMFTCAVRFETNGANASRREPHKEHGRFLLH